MYNEKTKKMRYVLKIGQLTTTYDNFDDFVEALRDCLLYTSPSPRDA